MGYWVHDKEVLDILKKNHIRYEREDHWSSFTFDYLFGHGKPVHLKGGTLILLGARLHVARGTRYTRYIQDEDLHRLPGRYIDTYPIDTNDVRQAFIRNGYTLTFVGSYNHHEYFEVNAYIPKGTLSKLPDGTVLFYEEDGSLLLYQK